MRLAEFVRRGVPLPQSRAGVTTVSTRRARQAKATGTTPTSSSVAFPVVATSDRRRSAATCDVLEEEIPITRAEIPSGARVFDSIVPDEWNIHDGYIADADRVRVVDFRRCSLPLCPTANRCGKRFRSRSSRPRLHTLRDEPDGSAPPDLCSDRTGGFCPLAPAQLKLAPGDTRS